MAGPERADRGRADPGLLAQERDLPIPGQRVRCRRGHSVSRYVHEGLAVLAERAPSLGAALRQGAAKAYLVLDGTVVPTDRVRMTRRGADREFYSGKVHHHGMNVQVIAGPFGELLYTSAAIPAARHDIAAAREHHLLDALDAMARTGRPVFADKGYRGAPPGISVPFMPCRKNPATGTYLLLSDNQKACNRAHAKLRAPGERANATLKSWRALTRVRMSPERITDLVHAVTTLITAGH